MFERPILFYSNYCIHSTNFINSLIKHLEIYEEFIRINIDVDPETKRRPQTFYEIQNMLNIKISEIPTIIVDNGKYVLTGKEAFKWLKHQIDKIEAERELTPFNPIEMGAFSDTYSSYGSNDMNDAKQQSFKFINNPDEKINTPQESSDKVSKDEYTKRQSERENFINITPQNQKALIPQQIQQKQFNNSYTSNKKRGKMSEKQKDFDQRYQQMMMERESLDNPKISKEMLDFQSGKLNL